MMKGYRTEQIYGEGYRDLKKVVTHEIKELGNEDIIDHLLEIKAINKREEVFKFVNYLYELGLTECMWLCDSKEDVINEYLQDEPEINNYEDYIDEYDLNNIFIISDLGTEGKLVAYNPELQQDSCGVF